MANNLGSRWSRCKATLIVSIYGTAAAFAGAVRLQKAGLLFHQAELDEKEMDERLSYLAEHELNRKAIAPIALTV
jgi:hypothetical protein